jgi:hypothetical protein
LSTFFTLTILSYDQRKMLRAWHKGHAGFVHAAPVERMLTKIDDH